MCKFGGAVDRQLVSDAVSSGSNAGANVVGNITGLIDNSLEQGFVKKQNDGTYDFIKQMNEGKKNAYNDTALVLKIAGIKGMVKKYGLNWDDDKIMEYAMRGGTLEGLGLFLHGSKGGNGLFLQGKGGYDISKDIGKNALKQWKEASNLSNVKKPKTQCRAYTAECLGMTKEEFAKHQRERAGGKGLFVQGKGKGKGKKTKSK